MLEYLDCLLQSLGSQDYMQNYHKVSLDLIMKVKIAYQNKI